MRFNPLCGILFFLAISSLSKLIGQSIERFETNWESLSNVEQAPDWFKDAKFGIYAHWGPVSSAFVGGDSTKHYAGWHGMKMYDNGQLEKDEKGNQPIIICIISRNTEIPLNLDTSTS